MLRDEQRAHNIRYHQVTKSCLITVIFCNFCALHFLSLNLFYVFKGLWIKFITFFPVAPLYLQIVNFFPIIPIILVNYCFPCYFLNIFFFYLIVSYFGNFFLFLSKILITPLFPFSY